MSDDVAAVPCLREDGRWRCDGRAIINKEYPPVYWHAECLTAAGYAVVKVPEGVAVAHGTPLIWVGASGEGRYVIGPTP